MTPPPASDSPVVTPCDRYATAEAVSPDDPSRPHSGQTTVSRRLAEIRERNGYTANQVCDRLGSGRGQVGRIEADTWKRIDMSAIRDLLRT
jgi:hypothetical protein